MIVQPGNIVYLDGKRMDRAFEVDIVAGKVWIETGDYPGYKVVKGTKVELRTTQPVQTTENMQNSARGDKPDPNDFQYRYYDVPIKATIECLNVTHSGLDIVTFFTYTTPRGTAIPMLFIYATELIAPDEIVADIECKLKKLDRLIDG